MHKIGVLFLILLASCTHSKKEVVKKPVVVQTAIAKVQDAPIYNTYVGHIQPFVEVKVTAQVEGVLNGTFFTEGQEVKQGELLFTIDERPYLAQLARAKGALAESIANLKIAEETARRNARLAQDDYVSRLKYDQYLTNVARSQAEIEQNEAEITTAKINISYCRIHSPIDAVTGIIQVQQGNLIRNADEENPITVLTQIQPIYAYFSVPQSDLPEIMRLQKASPLTANALLGGHQYGGQLDLINNEVDDQTGSIWLRAVFPNEDKMLWPGQFTDVRLILKVKKNAVLVPVQAITLGQKGHYAFVIDGDIAKLRQVKVGKRLGDNYVVEEGISGREEVVTKGQINLINGSKVEVKNESL